MTFSSFRDDDDQPRIRVLAIGDYAGKVTLAEKLAHGTISPLGLASPTYTGLNPIFDFSSQLCQRVTIIRGSSTPWEFVTVRHWMDFEYLSAGLLSSIHCIMVLFPKTGPHSSKCFLQVQENVHSIIEKTYQTRFGFRVDDSARCLCPPILLVATTLTRECSMVSEDQIRKCVALEEGLIFGSCVVDLTAEALWDVMSETTTAGTTTPADGFALELQRMLKDAKVSGKDVCDQLLLVESIRLSESPEETPSSSSEKGMLWDLVIADKEKYWTFPREGDAGRKVERAFRMHRSKARSRKTMNETNESRSSIVVAGALSYVPVLDTQLNDIVGAAEYVYGDPFARVASVSESLFALSSAAPHPSYVSIRSIRETAVTLEFQHDGPVFGLAAIPSSDYSAGRIVSGDSGQNVFVSNAETGEGLAQLYSPDLVKRILHVPEWRHEQIFVGGVTSQLGMLELEELEFWGEEDYDIEYLGHDHDFLIRVDLNKMTKLMEYRHEFTYQAAFSGSSRSFGPSEEVWGLAADPSRRLLFSGSDDHAFRVWDIESGECVARVYVPRPRAVITCPERGLILVGTKKDNIQVFDVRKLTNRIALIGKPDSYSSGTIYDIARIDEDRFVSVSTHFAQKPKVRILDLASGGGEITKELEIADWIDEGVLYGVCVLNGDSSAILKGESTTLDERMELVSAWANCVVISFVDGSSLLLWSLAAALLDCL